MLGSRFKIEAKPGITLDPVAGRFRMENTIEDQTISKHISTIYIGSTVSNMNSEFDLES